VRPAAQKTPSAVGQAAARKMQDPTGKSQIPPDLVVKFQPIDIVDVIL
jgi:hypothetical protein